jgi:hypothetical protein
MDPTMLVITIGGTAMLLLILGGVLAICFGYQLVKTGVAGPEKALIKLGKFQASGQGVGSVLMVTAVAWAYFGVSIAPKFTNQNGRIEVVAFNTDKGKITAPTITVSGMLYVGTVKLDGQKIQTLFVEGAEKVAKNPSLNKDLSMGGSPATIDINDVSVSQKDGKVQVYTKLRSEKESTPITYVGVQQGTKWVFTPDVLQGKISNRDNIG